MIFIELKKFKSNLDKNSSSQCEGRCIFLQVADVVELQALVPRITSSNPTMGRTLFFFFSESLLQKNAKVFLCI